MVYVVIYIIASYLNATAITMCYKMEWGKITCSSKAEVFG